MSMYTLPTEVAARKARVARMLRRTFAVPFWVLLALFVVSWPAGLIYPTTGWYVARFLSPVLLIPITLIRAMPTTRVLGFSHYKNKHLRRRPGCLVGAGLFAAAFLLYGAASDLAPALVPTIPVNAKITKCTVQPAGDETGDSVTCAGNWTVGGIREIGQGIPVEGRPGSTVRIRVSQISANTAYARPTGSREAVGAALAAGGVLVTAAALSSLIASRDRIRRGLDDVIAGRASVPAQVLHGSPRRN